MTQSSPDSIAHGRMNFILRQVKPEKAKALIEAFDAILMPNCDGAAPVAMPDAIAALCATIANVVSQQDERGQVVLLSAVGRMISVNLTSANNSRALERIAGEAVERAEAVTQRLGGTPA